MVRPWCVCVFFVKAGEVRSCCRVWISETSSSNERGVNGKWIRGNCTWCGARGTGNSRSRAQTSSRNRPREAKSSRDRARERGEGVNG